MATLEALLNEIFAGERPALYVEFEGWLRHSRRFRAFATSYHSKIRAKLKNVRDDSGMRDLRAELETAFLLSGDERFTLEYEKYAASRQRGPDFTITFRTHTPFNLEVRRLRHAELDAQNAEGRTNKLLAVLCDKVGQMPPSIVNLLWLAAERPIAEADLTGAANTLRQLAEHKAEEFFTRRGFESATHFLKQYGQLSGIVLWQTGRPAIWLNGLARHKAPLAIVTAIQRLGALAPGMMSLDDLRSPDA